MLVNWLGLKRLMVEKSCTMFTLVTPQVPRALAFTDVCETFLMKQKDITSTRVNYILIKKLW